MKILIWGTGNIAQEIIESGINGEVIGFIRSKPGQKMFYEKPVYLPDEINVNYDYIFVATIHADEIYDTIKKLNIPLNKICFYRLPVVPAVDADINMERAKQFMQGRSLDIVDCGVRGKKAQFIQRDLELYERMNTRESFRYDEAKQYYIEEDKYAKAGTLGQYFFQDLWGARLINQHNPEHHYDIGSRIDGFISHLLSFRDHITLIDIRPQPGEIPGVDFLQADATNLDTIPDNSIESLSALCSLEHFGLGRYGDKIDPEACFKAFHAIQKKVKAQGYVYIAVPVGREHLEFNAHRVFFARTIVESFDQMKLIEYSVTDGTGIDENVPIDQYDSYDGWERTGLFCFQKREQ